MWVEEFASSEIKANQMPFITETEFRGMPIQLSETLDGLYELEKKVILYLKEQ